MPFKFDIEGPETRKARELQQRLQELQAKRLEMDLDPNAMLQQQTQRAEAAALQGFNPQAFLILEHYLQHYQIMIEPFLVEYRLELAFQFQVFFDNQQFHQEPSGQQPVRLGLLAG